MSASFNHSRADGPFNPCPTCLSEMSREQLLELASDLLVEESLSREERDGLRAVARLTKEYLAVDGSEGTSDALVLRSVGERLRAALAKLDGGR